MKKRWLSLFLGLGVLLFWPSVQASKEEGVIFPLPSFHFEEQKVSLVPYHHYTSHKEVLKDIIQDPGVYRFLPSGTPWHETFIEITHTVYQQGNRAFEISSRYSPNLFTVCWLYINEEKPVGFIGFQPEIVLSPPLTEVFFALKESVQWNGLLGLALEKLLPWFDQTVRGRPLRFLRPFNYVATEALLNSYGFSPRRNSEGHVLSLVKGNINYKVHERQSTLTQY